MKHLKLIGFAAIAAMALTAVLGAGSASAAGGTTLCKTNETPCAATNHYAIGQEIVATSTNPRLTSNLGEVTCNNSEVKGKTTSTGSNKTSVSGEITSLSFTNNCVLHTPFGFTDACTVTAINLPYAATVSNTAGTMNGPLTVSGSPGAKVDCGSALKCQFTAKGGSITLDVTGGAPATVLAEKEELERTVYEGGICPSEATWDATYTVTTPNPLYLAQST
jgi:hypothetical protein